jgi:predicted phosphodiesterase
MQYAPARPLGRPVDCPPPSRSVSPSSPTTTATARAAGRARRIEELGIEEVLCGGDLVGYGPHPTEVCDLIQRRGIPTVYGNDDFAIGRDLEDCGCAYVTGYDRALGHQSVRWTLAHTSRAAKHFMRGLPFDLRRPVGATRIHLVHGSPRKVNEYLFEEKPARLYERLAAAEDTDVVVLGHTHRPRVREHGGVVFLSCGSVGEPEDADPAPTSPSSTPAAAGCG